MQRPLDYASMHVNVTFESYTIFLPGEDYFGFSVPFSNTFLHILQGS